MALIDFYQLAVLHKLSRDNGAVFSKPSNPPPMPATRSSARLSSTINPTTQLEPKTPQHDRDVTHSTRFSTPISVGTAILRKVEADTDQTIKYNREKYEQYIAQDFERHRVFVDIDVFMKHVLHVPDNWEELWGRTIRQIKRDRDFAKAIWDYTRQCGTQGVQEVTFYNPLVHIANTILKISESSSSDFTKPLTPQRYLRNDPRNIQCGMMKDLSPDLVAVHQESLKSFQPDEKDENKLQRSNITWAQPLQVLEVKPWDSALVDGSCMSMLKVNGRDPRENHAPAFTPSRHPKKTTAPPDVYLYGGDEAASAPEPAPSRKRPADEVPESNRKTVKVDHRSTPGGRPLERVPAWPNTQETEKQKDAYLQVGRYLLEQFSIPAFRSHATIGLVDRDRIQFFHANHSVILVSSAINFTARDWKDGLDKFIAIVIAFSRLSLRDNGVLHDLHKGKLFRDNKKLVTSDIPRGTLRMQEGNELALGGDGKTGPFTLKFGEVISHEPSLAGRATAVLHAKPSTLWKDINLVVKISWPGSDRVAENKFLERAVETAKSSPGDNWALNHLPQVLFAQDVVFGPDSTHEKVARLFDNAKFVDEKRPYVYERRTLRIIVQERLYPLKTLTNVRDIAQVLLDVACVHRWLYLRAGILHRDFSPNNIMYRIVKEKNKKGVSEDKVYGVLTDFDLASWKKELDNDYTKTSQQRTGTPPFMAYGLLKGIDPLHLYRHDLESLFYVMLITATHYEIQLPTKGKKDGGLRMRRGVEELPYQDWFNQESYKALAASKREFFAHWGKFNLSPGFEDFRGWLEVIHTCFFNGFHAKEVHMRKLELSPWHEDEGSEDDEAMITFNDETLEGHVNYSSLINPVHKLKGKLKGLVVRYYDPTFQTSAGRAKTRR